MVLWGIQDKGVPVAYQSLAKLFYKDSSPERFSRNEARAAQRRDAESTFRTGLDMGAGELFLAVPRELSLLNEHVLRHERKVSGLLRSLPPIAHAALVRRLVADEVVCSNEIEDVHSTRRQISELLEAELESPRRSPDENRRFREFTRLYLELTDRNHTVPRTPADVRAIYDRVMAGEDLKGNMPDGTLFRRGRVEILGHGGKVLHEGLYPESAIISAMECMLALVSSEAVPETYGAIVSHYIFEAAHPFYDGNGRTGRYLLALFLSEPLSISTSLSLSRAIAENKNAYYKAFKDADHPQNHGELTGFVMSMMELILQAQENIVEDLEEKRARLEEAQGGLRGVEERFGLRRQEVDMVFLLLQVDLFGAIPDVSLAEMARHVGLGPQMTRRYARRLEEAGLATVVRKNPLRFVLSREAEGLLGISSTLRAQE